MNKLTIKNTHFELTQFKTRSIIILQDFSVGLEVGLVFGNTH